MSRRQLAVFFDRDGVLNADTGYVHRIEDVQWIPGARELVGQLYGNGRKLFVVTNQSGVARGYYTEADVQKLHREMNREFSKYGGKIEEFFYCPHLQGAKIAAYDRDCPCRKPAPGMILEAMRKYGLERENCLLIGDSRRDIEAAERAGIRGFLFPGGNLLEFWNSIQSEQRESDGKQNV